MNKLVVCLLFSISSSWADTTLVRQMLRSGLSEQSDGSRPGGQDLTSELDDATNNLTDSELDSLLPLAMQCVRSSRLDARNVGITFLLAVVTRPEGFKLMEPYVGELAAFLDEPGSLFRRGVLTVLVTRPEVSVKWISTVAAHLEDKNNSPEETSAIVFLLLAAPASDPPMLHKVLTYVTKRSEEEVTDAALRGLHVAHSLNAEALDFVGIGLDSSDKSIREAAVGVVRSLPKDVRTKFAAQLGRLARDPKETELTRSLAAEALGK